MDHRQRHRSIVAGDSANLSSWMISFAWDVTWSYDHREAQLRQYAKLAVYRTVHEMLGRWLVWYTAETGLGPKEVIRWCYERGTNDAAWDAISEMWTNPRHALYDSFWEKLHAEEDAYRLAHPNRVATP